MDDGKKTYFAYGGTGILLSNPAIKKFVHRTRDHVHGNFTEPSITEKWAQLAKDDCCGDSVLGFALANQGIFLSGLYPMFNPHPLHGIPFGPSAKPYWCQPGLTLHKSWPRALPVLYADIVDYLSLANITEERQHWQNSDWAGFEEGPESPVNIDTSACAEGCHTHSECFQWTFFSKISWGKEPSERKCTFVRSIRLGSPKDPEVTLTSRSVWTGGWDLVKVKGWVNGVECADPEWVEPSIEKIY
ncbi:hypothetical protein BGW36DRAFT_433230 [Talaromyces proteolyticus]|uniref:Uncharacterized protein n=1 Tax=Talaromyces proteolyticus TaxID=1131652 RepID=A0AAD4PS28_9EURO|nr:uncharacterized protein BGW36DRAFT_433230 [Talaromyces proteolyticus]KAH8690280.1 hypothetical protein BGW36DRAFT_433230 [Talaromyces proteolyticus]